MKISNASKKVLASALSAAMVVAFAPTAAFGAVAAGNTVNVKFDTTGLTVADQNTELSSEAYQLRATGTNQLTLPDLSNHGYMFDAKTPVAGWYLDLNGVSGYQDGVDVAVDMNDPAAPTLSSDQLLAGTTVTLLPMKAAATVAVTGMDTVKQKYAAADTISFTVKNTGASTTENLRVSLKKDGKEVAYQMVSSIAATTGTANAEFTFVADDTASLAAGQVKVGEWGKGTWTVDAVATGSQKTVASKIVEVTEVSIEGVFGAKLADTNATAQDKTQNGQAVLAVVGQPVGVQLKAAGAEVDVTASKIVKNSAGADTPVQAVAYKGATGTITSDTDIANLTKDGENVKVAANMKLTPAYGDAAEIGDVTFTPATGGAYDAISAEALYTVSGAEYTATLSGAASATKTANGNGNKVTFNLINFGSNGAAAGTYTVTITQTTDKGTNQEKTVTVGTASITLTEVTVDEGEGSVNAGKKEQTSKSLKTSTTKIQSVIPSSAPNAKDGFRFVGWSIDGTSVVTGKEAVGESAVTLKALWESSVAAAPTFSYADGKLTLANNAGDGYELFYLIGDAASASVCTKKYTGPISLDVSKDANMTVSFVAKRKASVTTGETASDVVKISSYKKNASAIEAWVKSLLNANTSDSTSNAPKYYTSVLPTAAADAKAAITALNYQDAKGWNAAMLEQKTAALQKVADYENGVIDALAAGVDNADGTKTVLNGSVAAKQKEAVAAVVKDFGLNNDYKADGITLDATTKSTKAYGTDAAYVSAIKKAAADAKAAAITYKADDVKAAKAVTDALKGAKTTDELTAALKAYNDLSATQKELVAAADVAAAQAALNKAELAEAQDEAAIAKVKGKTVKAKAKKATKSSLKVVTSKSGAKSTFKKVTKNSKVTVSKSGKIVVKKGLKAGKKYTVKVKATVGASTKTVKVIVKVAK